MNHLKIVTTLIDGLRADSGATVSHEGLPVRTGLAVAVAKRHEKTSLMRTEGFVPAYVVKAIHGYVQRKAELVEANPALCFGVWRDPDDGKVYLDLTEVFSTSNIDRAIKCAKERDQLAIHHLSTGTTLRIE